MPSTNSARDRIIHVEAIVLRRLEYGETDRILTIMSDKFGKMRIIAKGIRRPASRLAAHLELFSRTSLILSRGRDLDIVTSADNSNMHERLRTDLNALAIASHCAELVDRFLVDRDENLTTFRNLATALSTLNAGAAPARVARWFEMRLLGEMGVQPELFRCVVCEREVLAEPNRFSTRLGGILCDEHGEGETGSLELSLAAQKLMRMLVRENLDAFLALNAPEPVADEIEIALSSFTKQQLERDLNSLRIMRRVEESLPVWENYRSTK